MTRVLVCGGRDYADKARAWRVISENIPWHGPDSDGNTMPQDVTIIHGACPTGADRWADEFAVVHWTAIKEYPADWRAHGKAAGPMRNQRMLDEGRPDLVIAFPGGRGTADMVRRTKAAGVRVIEALAAPDSESRIEE